MGRPYSLDLRERVVAAVEKGGLSCNRAAAQFGLGISTVINWVRRVRETEGKFRVETIRFVADPQIFSDVCELICDAAYDFLYNEGFLDLPGDWRQKLADGR